MSSVWAELRRRNVVKVAVAYAIVGWLLVEVASVVLPTFKAPEWIMQVFTFLVIVGFPLALILAWAFELTPEGIKREKDVDRSQSITHVTGRNIDYIIIAALVLVLGFFAFDKFVLDPSRDAELVRATTEAVTEQAVETANAETADKSIAVLPFVNMSDDPANAYFSDGIAEELLNVLIKVEGLRVVSRSSSFAFKGKDISIPDIARKLNVDHILEGSVRKAGNTVRVTAQLIDVRTDSHLWSGTYDRELEDIFAIQDEISSAIVDALKLALGLDMAGLNQLSKVISVEAYDLYLKGMQAYGVATVNSRQKAKSFFEQAIELEPAYAEAWYRLARTIMYLYWTQPDFESPEAAALKAIELDPTLGGAYTVLSLIYPWDRVEIPDLRTKAVILSPNDAFVVLHYGRALEWLHRAAEADRYIARAVLLDPLNLEYRNIYGLFNMYRGRTKKALAIAEDVVEDNPDYAEAWSTLGSIKAVNMGDLVGGVTSFLRATGIDPDRAYLYVKVAGIYLALGDLGTARTWLNRLRTAWPDYSQTDVLDYQWLYLDGQFDAARILAQEKFDADLTAREFFRIRLVVDLLERNEYVEAIDLILDRGENLASFINAPVSESRYEMSGYNGSFSLAAYLQFAYAKAGDTAKAKALVDRLRFYGLEGRLQIDLEPLAHAYLSEAQKLLREGQSDAALAALETAVNKNLRIDWSNNQWQFSIRDNILFSEIREHPRFLALLEIIESDMAQQKADLEALLQSDHL